MTTLRVVADYVPEGSATYLTAGKVYEAEMQDYSYHDGGDIIDDEGHVVFIVLEQCAHLCGGSWRIVE